MTTLEPALALIKSKRNAEAEQYLRQLVAERELYAEAWLLLGMVVENDEERLTAWRNVLYINPHHAQAQRYLSTHYVKLARQAQEPTAAYDHLCQAVELDESNLEAWQRLGKAAEALDDRIIALENSIALGGGDGYTAAQLAYLQRIGRDPFRTADYYTHRGDIARAEQIYRRLIATPPSRTAAKRAHSALETLRRRAQNKPFIAVPRPVSTLARLSFGSFLLYALLLFIHTGLNPWSITPLHFTGGFMVLFGTFLILGVKTSPENRWWGKLWGGYAFAWPVRVGVWGMGWLCTAVPYSWLLVEAWVRYQQFTLPPVPW